VEILSLVSCENLISYRKEFISYGIITTWRPRGGGTARLTFQTVDIRIDVISHEAVSVDDASVTLKSNNSQLE